MDWKKGKFKSYRALRTIHLGPLERNLPAGDVIEYDGFTLKWEGEEVAMNSVRGGIVKGWIVPADSSQTEYTHTTEAPQVTPATDAGSKEKTEVRMRTVVDEERHVSMIPSVKKKAQEGIQFAETKTAPRFNENEGIPIARFKKSTKSRVQLDGKTATNVIEQAGSQGVEVERLVPQRDPQIHEKYAEKTPKAPKSKKVASQGSTESASSEDKGVQVLPGVYWDMSPHWKTRGKIAVEKYSDNPAILEAIRKVETKGVVKMLDKIG